MQKILKEQVQCDQMLEVQSSKFSLKVDQEVFT